MWEKFTTKWLVDSGEWRRVGECVTPWPCFVVTARNEFIEQHPDALKAMMEVLMEVSCFVRINKQKQKKGRQQHSNNKA